LLLSRSLVKSYSKLYVAAQILPACVLGVTLDVVVFIYRKQEEKVLCTLPVPMWGGINEIYANCIIIVCVLIISCYGSFIFFLKRVRMSSEKIKGIYRSLILISLSVVFGYFSTMIVVSAKGLLNLKVEMISLTLFAGLFATSATAVNFFIYYGIRLERRFIFSEVSQNQKLVDSSRP
ncbi:hypothetical protein COOONC_00935, partial [Cooperia oncophora]